MSIEELKNRSDLTVEEIELLMKNEKDIKVYKKLSYIRFRALGYSKLESFDLAFIKKTTDIILKINGLKRDIMGY